MGLRRRPRLPARGPSRSLGGGQPVEQRGPESAGLLVLRDVTGISDFDITRSRYRCRDGPVPRRAADEVLLSGDHQGRAGDPCEGGQDIDVVEVVDIAEPCVGHGPIAPYLGPDPREMRGGQRGAWIDEIHRPGRIEAGDPVFLVPLLVVRPGEGAYRGVVPRLAGVPGI